MKLRNSIIAMFASLAVFAGCQEKEEDFGDPMVSLSKTELTFDIAGGSQTVELTATMAWELKDYSQYASWLSVTPDKGQPSKSTQTLTVKVTENTAADREAVIAVWGNVLNNEYLKIIQPGPKGDANTLTVKEFIEKADTQNEYVLNGTVSGFNSQYCSFDLTDATGKIYVYSVSNKDEWSSKIKNGGSVSLRGTYKYYASKDQHEVVDATILSFEPSGSGSTGTPSGNGSEASPYNATAAKNAAEALAADASTSEFYYIKGFVKSIKSIDTGSYGNASFYITDTKAGDTDEFYCYQVMYLDGAKFSSEDQLKVGDEVVVYAQLTNYKGNTPETVGKGSGKLVSINGQTGTGSGSGDQGGETQEVKTVTVAEFIAAEESSTQPYKLTGTITGSINETYGNFDLQDESGTVYVYGLTKTDLGYGTKNDQSYASLGLKKGDTVTLIGYRGSYNGKIEVMYAYYVSHTAGSGSGNEGGNEGGGDQGGNTEEVKTATVAEFIAAAESSTQPYKLTGTITGSINDTYGNFDLQDATGTVYVYGLTKTDLGYGASNDKSYKSLGLKAGDEVTIIGYRGSYNGKVEVMYAYYVSHTAGSGSGDQGGDQGGSGSGSVSLEAGENEVLHVLTLDEIKACMAKSTSATYTDITIESAGGNWTGNVYHASANTFLQFRNNNASYLTSPEYSSKIKRIVIVTTGSKFDQSTAKTLRVAAVPTVDPAALPTGKGADGKNITYTAAQMSGAYGSVNVNTKGKEQTLQMNVTEDAKQFSLLTIDGAMYLDAIYVFCEK